MAKEIVPFIAIPVGMMRCIACSDYKRHPGKMWLGYNRQTGEDLTIDCPKCNGTGQVERYQYVDARTGREIDYENHGLTFVHAGGSQ